MVLGCSCPTDRRTYLYVGKATLLRNRLQVHAFGGSSQPPSSWIFEFLEEPHNHLVLASAWYVPKSDLAIAETSLIDSLTPLRNRNDRGIGRQDLWPYRHPDVDWIDIQDLEPDKKHTRNIARNSPVRHEPAVYAWFVDPGMDLWATHSLLKNFRNDRAAKHQEPERSIRNTIARRLRNSRISTDNRRDEGGEISKGLAGDL